MPSSKLVFRNKPEITVRYEGTPSHPAFRLGFEVREDAVCLVHGADVLSAESAAALVLGDFLFPDLKLN